jgi:uncharacterized membrane protein
VTVATPVSTAAGAGPAGADVGRGGAWWVLIAGIAGLIASLTLTAEKIRTLADASYVPSCNLNPILSCGSVMTTPQALLLGVPNSLLGIAAFTVVAVSGLLAVTKVQLPLWYWIGLTTGTLAGAGFVHWLIFASLYRIGTLCPYCMVVWAITIPLLVVLASTVFRSLRPDGGGPVARVLYRWRWSLTALWFIALALLISVRFQNYWSTLL